MTTWTIVNVAKLIPRIMMPSPFENLLDATTQREKLPAASDATLAIQACSSSAKQRAMP
jgi:hypothetical protein